MKRLVLLFLSASLLTGCTSFELSRVRNDLARQAPEAKIGDGYAFSFGKISIGLARLLAGFGGEDGDVAQSILGEVQRVQFAKYDVDGDLNASRLAMPGRLRHYLEDENWEHLASVRTANEAVWVLYREEDNAIRDLFAVVLDAEELVLARITGNLNAVVLTALAEQDIEIPYFNDDEESQPAAVASDEMLETAAELAP